MQMHNLEKTGFIFDVDGTLVITESIYMDLILPYLNKHGLDIDLAFYYENFSGKNFNYIFEYANSLLQEQSKPLINISKAIQTIDQLYFQQINQHGLQNTKGSIELVQKLANYNIQRAIASNAPKNIIHRNLTTSTHIQYFDSHTIFSAYQFQEWKPVPTVYQAAHQSLDTSIINRLIIFEDSISGLQAIDNLQRVLSEIEVVGVFVNNGHNSILSNSLPKTIKHEVTNLYDILEII